MDIATTIHDPDGIMSSWLEKHESTLQRLNSKIYVAHTKNTDKSLISKLNKLGTKTFVGGLWGESRLATLDLAGKDNCENLLFVDFDKILSWLDNCPEEFEKIIQSEPDCNFTIIGRDDETMSTYPISWQKAEGIVDYLVSQILKKTIDCHTAVYILDRKAQTYILKFGQEKAWGATVEWPLIAHIQGLSIDYKTAKGLVWEDPIKFSQEVKQYASFVQWQHTKFEGIDEWEKRLNIAHVQTEVIRRLTLEGLDRQRLASL